MARILHELDDFQESQILCEELCKEFNSSLGGDHKEMAAIELTECLFRKIELPYRLNRPESRRVMFVSELLYCRVNKYWSCVDLTARASESKQVPIR